MKRIAIGLLPLLLLAAGARAQVVIGDAKPQVEVEQDAIRVSLKVYMDAIVKGDIAKAKTYYACSKPADKLLVDLFVDTDVKIEALRISAEKHFGHKVWQEIATLVGGAVPEQALHAKATPDEQHPEIMNVDLFPEATETAEQRWFAQIPMEQGKDGWMFADISKQPAHEKIYFRRWHRDVIAEVELLTKSIDSGAMKTAEQFQAAVKKMVTETLDNAAEDADVLINADANQAGQQGVILVPQNHNDVNDPGPQDLMIDQ